VVKVLPHYQAGWTHEWFEGFQTFTGAELHWSLIPMKWLECGIFLESFVSCCRKLAFYSWLQISFPCSANGATSSDAGRWLYGWLLWYEVKFYYVAKCYIFFSLNLLEQFYVRYFDCIVNDFSFYWYVIIDLHPNYFIGLLFTGANNKFHFARPASAQHAADILGTTPEELSRAIFSAGQSGQSVSPAYRSLAPSLHRLMLQSLGNSLT